MENETTILNRLVVFLTALCIVLMLVIAYQHAEYTELAEQNQRMEKQIKEMSAQVNEIWTEYMGVMKRIQQHG